MCHVQVGHGSQVDLSERVPERKAEECRREAHGPELWCISQGVCVYVCVCNGQLGFQSETSLCSLLTHNELKHCSA